MGVGSRHPGRPPAGRGGGLYPTCSWRSSEARIRILSGAWVSESTLILTGFFLSSFGCTKKVAWWYGSRRL